MSKFKEAKKAQKRNFKVNTKKVFTEDGEVCAIVFGGVHLHQTSEGACQVIL